MCIYIIIYIYMCLRTHTHVLNGFGIYIYIHVYYKIRCPYYGFRLLSEAVELLSSALAPPAPPRLTFAAWRIAGSCTGTALWLAHIYIYTCTDIYICIYMHMYVYVYIHIRSTALRFDYEFTVFSSSS